MFVTPEEVTKYIVDLLKEKGPEIGIAYIGDGEETLIPEYPAVLVVSGPTVRDYHTTHQFAVFFNVVLWVYHATVSIQHKTRIRKDLELCSGVRNVLHKSLTLEGNIINGYVDNEAPGVINRAKGEAVVGTRMSWVGESREAFK